MAVGDILGFIKNRANNKAINGGIDFWQRGTSFLSMTSGTFTADRFSYYQSGAYGVRCDRSTDVPAWSKGSYSMKFECTTAVAAPSGNDFSQFNHTIEGVFFRDLIGTDVKIGFNFKASKVGTYVVVCRNGNVTRSFATTFNVSSINTWERYYVNVPSDADLTGYTKDNTASLILTICFSNSVGTSLYRITGLNAWESVSNGFISDSQTNLWDTIGATAFVSDIALFDAKHGNVEFSRAGNTYSEELSLCQRYYEFGRTGVEAYSWGTGSHPNVLVNYKSEKRSAPVLSFNFLSGNGVSGSPAIWGGVSDTSGFGYQDNTTITGGTYSISDWTADAEL